MSERKCRSGKSADHPHPVDVTAGRNLRIARLRAGYSQERLGRAVGISFQQIQKYERGANRLALSRAWEFARVLNISVASLFEDVDEMPTPRLPDRPCYRRWMDLYARAQAADLLADLVRIAENIIGIRETVAATASLSDGN